MACGEEELNECVDERPRECKGVETWCDMEGLEGCGEKEVKGCEAEGWRGCKAGGVTGCGDEGPTSRVVFGVEGWGVHGAEKPCRDWVKGAGWGARQALSRGGKLAGLRGASRLVVASGKEVSFITFPCRITRAKFSPGCLAFSSSLPGREGPYVEGSTASVFSGEVFSPLVKDARVKFPLSLAESSAGPCVGSVREEGMLQA